MLCFILIGCEKKKLNSINDLEVQIELLDIDNNSARSFNYGEDLVFKYIEKNKTQETINYFGTHCPSFHFKVYDENDILIGDAIPNNWGCTDDLQLLEIGSGEIKVTEINWFNDPDNTFLSVGNYKLKYSINIRIPKIDESKIYKMEIEFKIE